MFNCYLEDEESNFVYFNVQQREIYDTYHRDVSQLATSRPYIKSSATTNTINHFIWILLIISHHRKNMKIASSSKI